MAGKSMREWFEVMQEHRRKALSEQYDVFQRALAESCDKIEQLRQATWKAAGPPTNWPPSTNAPHVSHETQDSIAAQLAYGEQCADTDGLALLAASEHSDAVTISRREYRELQNKATALKELRDNKEWLAGSAMETMHDAVAAMKRANAERDAIRADYDIAKRCLEARIHDLEAQAVKLTRERNDALAQTSARHGVQREAATGASGPCETPRANPFAGGWATSWSMR